MTAFPSGDVSSLLEMTDDELYEALTEAVLGAGRGIGPEDPEGRRKFGRDWFAGRLDGFRKIVCKNKSVTELRNVTRDEHTIAVAGVADALLGSIGQPAAAVVAVLITRIGLDNFCHTYWS